MIEKIEAFLTPTTRKVLYRIAVAVLGFLTLKGVIAGDVASLVNLILAGLFEVAAQNVPTTKEEAAESAAEAVKESVEASIEDEPETADAEEELATADEGA